MLHTSVEEPWWDPEENEGIQGTVDFVGYLSRSSDRNLEFLSEKLRDRYGLGYTPVLYYERPAWWERIFKLVKRTTADRC